MAQVLRLSSRLPLASRRAEHCEDLQEIRAGIISSRQQISMAGMRQSSRALATSNPTLRTCVQPHQFFFALCAI